MSTLDELEPVAEWEPVADDMGPLAKDDIKALRAADSVTFRHSTDGKHFITALKRFEFNGFESEVRREIRVPSNIRSYDSNHHRKYKHAFQMIQSAQYASDWKTIALLLRAGDELALLWSAGNSNAYTDDAELRRDELRLIVNRGKHRMTFLIEVGVCRDNTARMVQS